MEFEQRRRIRAILDDLSLTADEAQAAGRLAVRYCKEGSMTGVLCEAGLFHPNDVLRVLGISTSTLSRWYRGLAALPRAEYLVRLAKMIEERRVEEEAV